MPIRDLSDSVGLTFYGMAMVFKDTGRHRHEDTARLCGPHGQARPFPVKTIKLLTAKKQKELPSPYKFELFGVKHEIAPAVIHEIKEVVVGSVLPRPVAELFASVAEGNIYMDDKIQWFNDKNRTKQARKMADSALEYRDKAKFVLAAENAAVASGMTLSSMLDDSEDAREDRSIFSTAWSILTSIFDEQAFMEIVSEVRKGSGWIMANTSMKKSEDFWRNAFPSKKQPLPTVSGLVLIGDERAEADKARCRKAFEKRVAEIARKTKFEGVRQKQILAHRTRMTLLRDEVRHLTRMAR